MAVINIGFSDHFCGAIYNTFPNSMWKSEAVVVLGLSIVTIVNCLRAETGPKCANSFLVVKIFALYSIVLVGLAAMVRGTALAMNGGRFR